MRAARTLLALTFAALALVGHPVAAQGGTNTVVDVLAVGSMADNQISLVAALRPVPADPLGRGQVQVTSGRTKLPTRVEPVLSGATAIGLVIDASTAGSSSVQGGGLSGAASFLLQMPPGASTAVVADRRPPAVVGTTSTGATQDLQAVSSLRSGGVRATNAALELALRQLPPWPDAHRVVVLYTGAQNAGGEAATVLGERVRRAGAILAVVTTNPDPQYWARAAAATGGLAVRAEPARAITAFDQLADALRERYVVTFPRPSSAEALTLRFERPGQPFETALALPPAPAPSSQSGPAWLWPEGVTGLLVVFGAALIFLRRRRAEPATAPADTVPDIPDGPDAEVPALQPPVAQPPVAQPPVPQPPALQPPVPKPAGDPEPPDPDPPPVQTSLPGVRVFDLTQPGPPNEITGSLFEPRSVRDAREAAERGEDPQGEDPDRPEVDLTRDLEAQRQRRGKPGR